MSSTATNNGDIDSIKVLQEARATALSNAIKKTGIGVLIGGAASIGIFRPGFAAGMGYEQGNAILRSADLAVLEAAREHEEHTVVPPGVA